jgi:hypothetical protein
MLQVAESLAGPRPSWAGRPQLSAAPQPAAAAARAGAGDLGLASDLPGGAAPDRLGARRGPLHGLGGACPPPDAPAGRAGPTQRPAGALPTARRHRRVKTGYDYLHVAVDDRTRLAYVEALADQQGQTAAGFTARALAWFAGLGVQVERVLTDNGWCYRSQAFQQVLAQAGAAHRRTRPYRHKPTARPSGSTGPWPPSGPMPSCMPATKLAWPPCLAGCTTTTATDRIPPWTEGVRWNSSTTSLGTTPSGCWYRSGVAVRLARAEAGWWLLGRVGRAGRWPR